MQYKGIKVNKEKKEKQIIHTNTIQRNMEGDILWWDIKGSLKNQKDLKEALEAIWSGDMLKATYDPANKNRQLAADDEVVKLINSANIIYATNWAGLQSSLIWSESAVASTVPVRTSTWAIFTATPTNAWHATTKDYVDTWLAGKANTSHTHNASNIDAGVLAIARIPTGTSWTTVALGNHTHTFASLTSRPTTLSGYGITDGLNVSEKWANNWLATLDSNGKLSPSQIPALLVSEYLGNFANLSAALADSNVQTSQRWDWFTTNDDLTYIVIVDNPTTSSDVQVLKTPSGNVSSVNWQTGTVVLGKSDIGLGNVDNTSDLNKPISTLTQTALNGKANTTTTISAGTWLTGWGNLSTNRTISLNSASIASLALADTSLQPWDNISTLTNDVWYTTNTGTVSSLADLWITATASELNVLDGITATTTELNYTGWVTSNIQTQLNSKQATLVSWTNIKTINGNSLLGSGNVNISARWYYRFAIAWAIWTTRTNVANTVMATSSWTISSCHLWYWTAGNGTLTIDVNKNGTTIFSANPQITGTNQKTVTAGTISSWAVVAWDILTLDIDAVPWTPWVDLYVELVYS